MAGAEGRRGADGITARTIDEAEAKAERELLEDILYLTQDELSGVRPRC